METQKLRDLYISHIPKTKTILGFPEKYMEVLPYHKQVILVDR